MTDTYDVRRHVRVWPDEEGRHQHAADGRFLPQLPPLQKIEPNPTWIQLCVCGVRRGLHRWGDEACPNLLWRAGSGKQQWLSSFFVRKGMGPRYP